MNTSGAIRHASRPPEVAEILGVLGRWNVDYVLIGSAGAAAYGVDGEAGDLDIVPSCEAGNLERLIEVLNDLEAAPLGPFGEWDCEENGEWKWVARPTSERELAAWRPDPADLRTLDHLYVTRLGNFDVVPQIAGTYDTLRPRAVLRSIRGMSVRVAHVDELLARMTVPRREKDRGRIEHLRAMQRARPAGTDEAPSSPGPARNAPLEDGELLRQFESCALPFAEWNHRMHVKVAFLYLRDNPFEVALGKMRDGVRAYNAANNVPESEREGYNETTTCAFMHLIRATMNAYGSVFPTADADSFCDAHPQLLSRHVLRLFYSPERRLHADAKSRFVEPDLAPLPGIASPSCEPA